MGFLEGIFSNTALQEQALSFLPKVMESRGIETLIAILKPDGTIDIEMYAPGEYRGALPVLRTDMPIDTETGADNLVKPKTITIKSKKSNGKNNLGKRK